MLDQKEIQEQAEKLHAVLTHLKDRVKSIVNDGEDLNEASWNYQLGVLISGNDAKTLLEAQWMQEREKWISVGKSIPKLAKNSYYSDYVLTINEEHEQQVARFDWDKNKWIKNGKPCIIAWQELPSPPKEI